MSLFQREKEQVVTTLPQLETYVAMYAGHINGVLEVSSAEEDQRLVPGSFVEASIPDPDTNKFPIEFTPDSKNETSHSQIIDEGYFSANAVRVASRHRLRPQEEIKGRQYTKQGKIALRIVTRAWQEMDQGNFSMIVRAGKFGVLTTFHEPETYDVAERLLGEDIRIHRIVEPSSQSPRVIADVMSTFKHSLQRNIPDPITNPSAFDERRSLAAVFDESKPHHREDYVVIQLYPPPERSKPEINLDTAPEALGFIPTDKLRELRGNYEEVDDPYSAEANQVWAEWTAEAESILDLSASPPLEDPHWDRRLGMYIEECLMLRDGERDIDFEAKLRFTCEFAETIGNKRAVAVLEEAILQQEDRQI